MPRTTTAITSIAVLALAAAGCGSSKPLTESQFKVQANAICKKYKTQTAALNPVTGTSKAQVDLAVGQVADLIAREVLEIRALTPPAHIASEVTAMLAGIASGAATMHQQRSAVLTAGVNPFADANPKATALGLTQCVE